MNIHGLSGGDTPVWLRLVSFLGLGFFVFLAWLLSSERRKFPWRIVLFGTGLQLVLGVLVLRTPAGVWFFSVLNDAFVKLLSFTDDGSRFLFGDYLDEKFTVALNVLPTIIFFSSLMAVLYYYGVMQWVVKGFAWLMQRTLKTSGAETLSAAANIFVGQTEAPLMVKPFVQDMTRSELMTVMVGGFATIAGGVMAAYVGMLHEVFPDIAGHLVAASVIATPAGVVMAKVLEPETGTPKTSGTLKLDVPKLDANVIDAAARGAAEGLQLALNVAAMLLAFMSLVALLNYLVGLPVDWHNAAYPSSPWPALTLQKILGWIFWPIAFAMGVTPSECGQVAELLGEKTALNEFVAYLHLARDLGDEHVHHLSPRSVVISTYALCGFSNFGSIAIQIGGIGGLAPSRRSEIAQLGLRAMIGGSLACFTTACVAGLLV